jgi:GNAT superfamily N-acetyltransferase
MAWYTCANRALSRSAVRQSNQIKAKAQNPFAHVKNHWYLHHLSVDPAYQGNGFGKAAVRFLQDIAAQDELPIVVVASIQGAPMYRSLGFVDHGVVPLATGLVCDALVWYAPARSRKFVDPVGPPSIP